MFGMAGFAEMVGVEIHSRAVGVAGIGPQEHLMRFHGASGRRRGHITLDEPGVHRVGQVEELEVERELGVVARGAGVDHVAAPEGHHHQQLLLRPDPQLTGGDADVARERRPELPDDVGLAGVGDVEDQYAWVHVGTPGGAIRAGAGAVSIHGVWPGSGPAEAV